MLGAILQKAIPNVEVLLTMEPEDLAPIIFRLARDHVQNGMAHENSITTIIVETGLPATEEFCYRQRQKEVERALSEAWQWLRINMLVVPASGMNGGNGWMVFSQRGEAIASDQDFKRFREAAALPKALLHPSIADTVRGRGLCPEV